ncbi:MAG: hypothetical protein FI680_01155 [SAR202 cluster bacterium]|nr:hypothetical protein [SAR202 cluster bacterium]
MQATTKGGAGHHPPEILKKTSQEVNNDLLKTKSGAGTTFYVAAVILVGLTALGGVGFWMRSGDGFETHTPWAYLAAVFAFLLTTGLSAPLVAIAPRLARAHFSRPIARIAELWAAVGLVSLVIMVPLLLALPSASGRRSFWFTDLYREGWPAGAPHIYVILAVVFLVINGLALLWVGAIPDLAVVRDRTNSALHRKLALGWTGTATQWRKLRVWIGLLGAFYFMFLIFNHMVISFDLAQSLVPGYRDSIFPAFHALSGLQSALATTLVTMFIVRLCCGLKEYIGLDAFWGLAKLMMATSFLWAYFWWSGFIIFWYGRMPAEQNILYLYMVGPYKYFFLTTFTLNFLVPLLFFIWSPVRRSMLGPTLIASGILIGTFIDRLRIYTASYSVGLPGQKDYVGLDAPVEEFRRALTMMKPDIADVLMLIGVIAAAILSYMIFTRIFPLISLWSTKEGVLLQRVRPLAKMGLKVLAKPD